MEKGKSIFREKSLDRINSPEQLNDYIKVANPSVWIILVAVIILLLGVCSWGLFGTIDSSVKAVAIVDNGQMSCYIPENKASEVSINQDVDVDGQHYKITEISNTPVNAGEVLDSYAMHLSGISAEQWVYKITFDTDLEDGVYDADIRVESIHPSTFVMN